MADFKILPGLPGTGQYPKQFSNTGRGTYREGFVVEVQSDTGGKWVGNFQPGLSDFSSVYCYPNGADFIVISGGQAYVIDPESRRLLETFGGRIATVIELPASDSMLSQNRILFQSEQCFLAYGPSGLLWHQEILWNGTRLLRVDGENLTGEFHCPAQSSWIPFKLNVTTGEIQMEKQSPSKQQARPWWKLW